MTTKAVTKSRTVVAVEYSFEFEEECVRAPPALPRKSAPLPRQTHHNNAVQIARMTTLVAALPASVKSNGRRQRTPVGTTHAMAPSATEANTMAVAAPRRKPSASACVTWPELTNGVKRERHMRTFNNATAPQMNQK